MKAKLTAWQWCQRYIRLPFLITATAIVCLYFFNDNSALTYYESQLRIAALKAEIKENTDTLEHYRALTRDLDRDRESIERIVRERYHMRRANEDVYTYEKR